MSLTKYLSFVTFSSITPAFAAALTSAISSGLED